MEAIEVTARFDALGNITPLNFTWQGRSYPVDSTGRQWVDEQGRHILVMVPGERIYELFFEVRTGRWYLKKQGPDRSFV